MTRQPKLMHPTFSRTPNRSGIVPAEPDAARVDWRGFHDTLRDDSRRVPAGTDHPSWVHAGHTLTPDDPAPAYNGRCRGQLWVGPEDASGKSGAGDGIKAILTATGRALAYTATSHQTRGRRWHRPGIAGRP